VLLPRLASGKAKTKQLDFSSCVYHFLGENKVKAKGKGTKNGVAILMHFT